MMTLVIAIVDGVTGREAFQTSALATALWVARVARLVWKAVVPQIDGVNGVGPRPAPSINEERP
jgi:hypothetical protein